MLFRVHVYRRSAADRFGVALFLRPRTASQQVGAVDGPGRLGLDNAVIESWHSTVEFELRQLEHFTTKAQGRRRVATWIEEYNHDRRHSSLAMLSPIAYELQLTEQRDDPEAAA